MLACPPHPCGVGALPAPGSYRRSRTPSCGPGQGSCTSSGRSWERRYQGAGPPEAWLRGWGWERAVPARGSHHPDHTEGDSFPRTQPLPAGPLNRSSVERIPRRVRRSTYLYLLASSLKASSLPKANGLPCRLQAAQACLPHPWRWLLPGRAPALLSSRQGLCAGTSDQHGLPGISSPLPRLRAGSSLPKAAQHPSPRRPQRPGAPGTQWGSGLLCLLGLLPPRAPQEQARPLLLLPSKQLTR